MESGADIIELNAGGRITDPGNNRGGTNVIRNTYVSVLAADWLGIKTSSGAFSDQYLKISSTSTGTDEPSSRPSLRPTNQPSEEPSRVPTVSPEASPSSEPSLPTPQCSSYEECGATMNDCTEYICKEGNCEIINRPDGTPCTDDNIFTHGDKCFEGVCHGSHHPSAVPSFPPSGIPTQKPTPSPTSSCTYPDQDEWLIITTVTDWCRDRRSFGINEEITLIFYNANIDHDSVDKIEVEFRAGAKERKTKYKLDGTDAVELGQTDLSLGLPRKFEDGTYRLTILMGDIGLLGGWDDKFTDNNEDGSITPGETSTFKFKVEDRRDRYQLENANSDDLLSATEAIILTASSASSPSPSKAPSTKPSSVPSSSPTSSAPTAS